MSYYNDLAPSLKWIVEEMTGNLPIIRSSEEYSTNAINEQEDEANISITNQKPYFNKQQTKKTDIAI